MKKEYRICKNYEFSSIIHKQNFVKSSSFVCYIESKKETDKEITLSLLQHKLEENESLTLELEEMVILSLSQ